MFRDILQIQREIVLDGGSDMKRDKRKKEQESEKRERRD